jgi:hypothetical protein
VGTAAPGARGGSVAAGCAVLPISQRDHQQPCLLALREQQRALGRPPAGRARDNVVHPRVELQRPPVERHRGTVDAHAGLRQSALVRLAHAHYYARDALL